MRNITKRSSFIVLTVNDCKMLIIPQNGRKMNERMLQTFMMKMKQI